MRIMIVNVKADRVFLSELVVSLFESKVSVHLEGIYMSFEVEDISVFFKAVLHTYAVLSRDARGAFIKRRRTFRADDWPATFWYEITDDLKGVRAGRI